MDDDLIKKRLRDARYRKALAEMQEDADDRRHGTVGGYGYGCRCDRCRAASREYTATYLASGRHKQLAAKHLEVLQADPDDRRHGTRGGYGYGCRCDRCTAAETKGVRAWQAKAKVEKHGRQGYTRGCRCLECRKAENERQRKRYRKQRRQNPDGESR